MPGLAAGLYLVTMRYLGIGRGCCAASADPAAIAVRNSLRSIKVLVCPDLIQRSAVFVTVNSQPPTPNSQGVQQIAGKHDWELGIGRWKLTLSSELRCKAWP